MTRPIVRVEKLLSELAEDAEDTGIVNVSLANVIKSGKAQSIVIRNCKTSFASCNPVCLKIMFYNSATSRNLL